MKTTLFIYGILLMNMINNSYKPWREKDSVAYHGVYIFSDFSDYTGERFIIQELSISKENDTLRVLFRKYFNTSSPKECDYIPITNSAIHDNLLTASNWDAVLGEDLKGKFVYQYPPENAKGKVLKGMLLGKLFFRKIE